MNRKKVVSWMLSMTMALSMTSGSLPALGAEAVNSDEGVTSWVDLYQGLGVEASDAAGYYDVVTSATEFTSYHAKDIPGIVHRVTDADGNTLGLDGVVLEGKEVVQRVQLASASYEYTSKYGLGEFDIMPDDTVEGYVWNDYLASLYAVTISDGTTTVGAAPWIDYYGEAATSGPHYNKVQIAVNTGTALASNQAEVHRYDSMISEDGNLKPGTYTVTCYSEGYEPLVAENIEVKQVSGVELSANDIAVGSESVSVNGINTLPEDFDAAYYVDGTEQTMTITEGRFTSYNVSVPAGSKVGSHKVSVVDKSGKYVALEASFLITTDQVMAYYDAASESIVKADGVSDEEWNAYLSAISSVTVNGKSYSATGRGAVKVIGENGAIDFTLASGDVPVWNDNALNSMEITATAYKTNVKAIIQRGSVEDSAIYYAMMNVPFDEFYAGEMHENLEEVDVVSTATTSKFKMTGTTGLAQGTYNDGTNMCGITVAVKLTYAQFAKLYREDATTADAYYMSSVTTEEPAAYKELRADGSFSAMNTQKDASGLAIIDYTTETMYGDYQISVENASAGESGVKGETCTFLGAILSTSDGQSYAMYALENLWYSSRNPNLEIAWSVKGGKGLRKGHNREELPEFYQYDMNGKTLTNVKLITSIGVYDVACNQVLDRYEDGVVVVPVEKADQAMTVKASKTSIKGSAIAEKAQKVKLTVKGAVGKVTYKVSKSKYMSVKDGTVTFKKNTPAGTYKITVNAAGNEVTNKASAVVTVKIVKSAQPMKVNVTNKTYKKTTLKKSAKTFTIKTTKAAGKVTYKSNSKKVTVTSKGKVTVKKGTGKGTYKVTVTAAGNGCFKKGSKTVTIKVK